MRYKFVDGLYGEGVSFKAFSGRNAERILLIFDQVIHTHSPRYGYARRKRGQKWEKRSRRLP